MIELLNPLKEKTFRRMRGKAEAGKSGRNGWPNLEVIAYCVAVTPERKCLGGTDSHISHGFSASERSLPADRKALVRL
jgi:hypothetical protein